MLQKWQVSKEFQHLSVYWSTDMCVCTYVLQGLSLPLAAGGEVIGKRSRVFTSGYCRGFALPAVKHMVLLSGRLSVILCTFLN